MNFKFSVFCYKYKLQLSISDQKTVKIGKIRQDMNVSLLLFFYCPLVLLNALQTAKCNTLIWTPSLVNLKEQRLANIYKSNVFGKKLSLLKVVHLEAKYLLKRFLLIITP